MSYYTKFNGNDVTINFKSNEYALRNYFKGDNSGTYPAYTVTPSASRFTATGYYAYSDNLPVYIVTSTFRINLTCNNPQESTDANRYMYYTDSPANPTKYNNGGNTSYSIESISPSTKYDIYAGNYQIGGSSGQGVYGDYYPIKPTYGTYNGNDNWPITYKITDIDAYRGVNNVEQYRVLLKSGNTARISLDGDKIFKSTTFSSIAPIKKFKIVSSGNLYDAYTEASGFEFTLVRLVGGKPYGGTFDITFEGDYYINSLSITYYQ